MRRRYHHYRHRYRYNSYHSGRKKVIIGLLIFIILFVILGVQLRPIIKGITENEAKKMATNCVNSTVAELLSKSGISYNDMVSIERDNNGKILAITSNVVKMNELKSQILMAVQRELGNQENEVGVALGTLLGNDLLHGRGPRIPLKITLSGNVTGDFKSNFEAAGINQTRHQIYLEIHMSVYSFIPGFNTMTDVKTDVPIAETVIVGDVPQMYAGLGSNETLVTSSSQK